MRTLSSRSGVTVLELLVALILSLAVLTVVSALMRGLVNVTNRTLRHRALDRDATALVGIVSYDLRHAHAAETTVPTATVVEYRRPVADGEVCAVDASGVTVRDARWLALRAPDPARDLALLLPATAGSSWVERGIVSVSVANCPGGSPGRRIGLDAPVTDAAILRVIHPLRLRHYLSGGAGWLGIEPRLGGGTIQPIAGPYRTEEVSFTADAEAITLSVTPTALPAIRLRAGLEAEP